MAHKRSFCLSSTVCRQSESKDATPEEQHEEKTVERDNRRNCQQVYTSSPVKSSEKLQSEGAGKREPLPSVSAKIFAKSVSGMYEISPYATFSVGGNNSRSVTTSTLDYTMQFKTFGHIEDEDAGMYPKNASGKHNWHKHRYYSNDGKYNSVFISHQ